MLLNGLKNLIKNLKNLGFNQVRLCGKFRASGLQFVFFWDRTKINNIPGAAALAALAQEQVRPGLSPAAGHGNSSRLRDVAIVAHAVDQILLQMLGAQQMRRRCVEDLKQGRI